MLEDASADWGTLHKIKHADDDELMKVLFAHVSACTDPPPYSRVRAL